MSSSSLTALAPVSTSSETLGPQAVELAPDSLTPTSGALASEPQIVPPNWAASPHFARGARDDGPRSIVGPGAFPLGSPAAKFQDPQLFGRDRTNLPRPHPDDGSDDLASAPCAHKNTTQVVPRGDDP